MRDDFAVFICTHGRPTKQLTLETLRRCGYTGKVYLVLDNTDKTIQQYIDNYDPDTVIIFDKNYYINNCIDTGDNIGHYKCILYAKNAVEDIAKQLHLTYFIIADDDVKNFCIRMPIDDKLRRIPIQNLDTVFDAYLNMLFNPVAGIGFGYVTSYFLGAKAFSDEQLTKRFLPFQVILRNGNIDVNWISWMAEDNITELQSSVVGNIWMSIPYVMQDTEPIGKISGSGGMVETYQQSTRFKLDFNMVKYCPNRVCIKYRRGVLMAVRDNTICFPKIISERYKK